jgi:hypothetical protein
VSEAKGWMYDGLY